MAVHFTKQQINEIEQALIARSKRDSQFPGADTLDGTELIPIVQNGVNKIMTYSGLWNKVAADLQKFVEESLAMKVDKVEGKELSTNDFDDDYKGKLDNIQAGAEVNVNADWTAESGDAFILHKPDLSIYATNAQVEDIEALIPNAASTSNQLADKLFVNSSIATNTAEFKGTYDTLEELMTVVANLNDYGFVRNTDSLGNITFDRYKYLSNNTWLYEYSLNNSSFTQDQWNAINSGITLTLVEKLNGVAAGAQVNIIEGVQIDGSDLPITNKKVNIVLSGKVDKVAGKGLSTNDYSNSEKLKLDAFPAWSEIETFINSKVDKSDEEIKDEVIASAFAKLQSELDAIRIMLANYQINAKTASIDSMEYRIGGIPLILYSTTGGAPSASNVPLNWDEETMQAWSGVPRFVGQIYIDQSSNRKVYFAIAVTNSANDWVELN